MARRTTVKLPWSGRIQSIQPRIRLWRSWDERSHEYLGYALLLEDFSDPLNDLRVAIGKAPQAKHQLEVGDEISGESEPVADPRREVSRLYKTSKLKALKRTAPAEHKPPPWLGPAPSLDVYRERGHRRLSMRTFDTKCTECIWACEMPVEITLDNWNPRATRSRKETFCFGPKSCRLYKPGPARVVPGRRGRSWREPDWVEEEATTHRGPDD